MARNDKCRALQGFWHVKAEERHQSSFFGNRRALLATLPTVNSIMRCTAFLPPEL